MFGLLFRHHEVYPALLQITLFKQSQFVFNDIIRSRTELSAGCQFQSVCEKKLTHFLIGERFRAAN